MMPRRSWSRENTIAIIAIAVSIGGIFLSFFSPDVRHFLQLNQPDIVSKGSSNSNSNQTVQLTQPVDHAPTIIPGGTTPTGPSISRGSTWVGTLGNGACVNPSACGVRLQITFINGNGSFQGTWCADYSSPTGRDFSSDNRNAACENVSGSISSDQIRWQASGSVIYGSIDPFASHSGTINTDASILGDSGNLTLEEIA